MFRKKISKPLKSHYLLTTLLFLTGILTSLAVVAESKPPKITLGEEPPAQANKPTNATRTTSKSVASEELTTPHFHRFLCFGTYVDVMVIGVSKQKAQQAFKMVEKDFLYWDHVWNPWKKSAMARMNSLFTSTEWVSVAPSVRPLIVRAKQLSIKSKGLFNPSIGKLVKLWGFNQPPAQGSRPPDGERINLLVRNDPKMTDVVFDGIRIRSKNKHVQLDMGAIAKGFAINIAIDNLKKMGIENAIVNAGGDLKAMGKRLTRPWRIAIRDPRDKKDLIGSVYIEKEESVFTSGDYERFFTHNKVRYHHIIDPRNGYPAKESISVTVIHPDAALADAAATALFIAGPKQWVQIAKSMGVDKVMIIDKQGKIFVSLSMYNRLQLHLKKTTNLKVVPLDPSKRIR